MQFQRAPFWSFSLDRADFYGRRWCLHVGPLMVWLGQGKDNEPA